MGNIVYLFAVVLVIVWGIGFFVYSAGAIIHAILVLSVIIACVNNYIITGKDYARK